MCRALYDEDRKTKARSTLSPQTATVAENGEKTATVAEFGDSVDRLLRIIVIIKIIKVIIIIIIICNKETNKLQTYAVFLADSYMDTRYDSGVLM